MTHRSTSLISIALGALLLGCARTYAIWIGPDATVSTLAFGLASKPHGSHLEALNWFGVSTCQAVDSNLGFHGRKRIWAVRGWDLPDSSRLIHSIAYGHVPPGFTESVPAQPLGPGCYVASASASAYEEAEVYFWVDPDRAVKPWTRAQMDSARAVLPRPTEDLTASVESVGYPIPEACQERHLRLPSVDKMHEVEIDTTSWGAYSGRYRLFLFAPKKVRTSIGVRERRLDIEFGTVPAPPQEKYTYQFVGRGFLYGSLEALTIGSLTAPVDSGAGSGYAFHVGRSVAWGSVGWGVGSRGLDSGVIFELAALAPGRFVGWWLDGASSTTAGAYGAFCAVRLD